MHQDAALRRQRAGEEQLVGAQVPREEHPSHERADTDATFSRVPRELVGVTGRIIELVLRRPDERIRGRVLAVVDLRTRHVDVDAAHRRDVADPQLRQTFARDLVHRAQAHTVAVGVLQMLVDPAARVVVLELARREHHLSSPTAHLVAIDVHVAKVVVGPDFLDLLVRCQEWADVPEANVLDRGRVLLKQRGVDDRVQLEVAFLDVLEVVGLAGEAQGVLDERLFLDELVGLDDEPLECSRDDDASHDVGHDEQARTRHDPAHATSPDAVRQNPGRHQGDADEDTQTGKRGVDVGVAGAEHRSRRRKQDIVLR